ncbi:hypothetical protein [Streptomyces sp. NBC_01538]|uniref:hypothetical protein n=1 Tax=Streptomyces sp. NBC_01538 TaxID=2903897 RepID=UPI003869493A
MTDGRRPAPARQGVRSSPSREPTHGGGGIVQPGRRRLPDGIKLVVGHERGPDWAGAPRG